MKDLNLTKETGKIFDIKSSDSGISITDFDLRHGGKSKEEVAYLYQELFNTKLPRGTFN